MFLRSKIQDVLFLDIETVSPHAEHGRIVCICVGNIGKEPSCDFLKLRCFYNDDERLLLLEFNAFLQKLNLSTILCAHNGKVFDFPFICRRMLIHGIEIPEILSNGTHKAPELQHLDTLEYWKFGDHGHFTSLAQLAQLFKIETSTNDFDRSVVQKVNYKQNDLQHIVDYCYNDVVTVAQLLLRFSNQNTIRTENIYYV
jgi:uncharacterized protein YprB with RNaseH-like and TPR domain